MKKTNPIRLYSAKVLMLFFSALLIVSCKDDADKAVPKTISDHIIETPNLSILEAAIRHAGLVDALKSGYLTIFAPDDSAFVASGYSSESAITSLPPADVKKLLEYHILAERIQSSDLQNGPNSVRKSFSGDSIYIGKNENGVFVNGHAIKYREVSTANGVIHLVDHVLTPPTKNIVELVQTDADLTFLTAAVARVAAAFPQVTALLSARSGNYTVFAPNNQAFMNAGFTSLGQIQTANVATLSNVLLYHLVAVRIFTNNMAPGKITTMSSGKTIDVTTTNGIKLTGNGNIGFSASIVKADQLATNGTVHTIDRLLVP
jgi:uncharacterized surface protein with fasciclin (FAS1) repeats